MSFDRISIAEQQLDRMHGFLPRIDAKVAAVVTWLSVQLTVIALNTKLEDLVSIFVALPFSSFIVSASVSALSLWRCLFPDTRSGIPSLIFFAEIAKLKRNDFVDRYCQVDESDLLEDLADQIWRNAEIVCDKYKAVQASIRWASISFGCMLLLVLATSFVHQSFPKVSG